MLRVLSRVLRTTARHAVFASALAGLTMVSSGGATAGDLGPPVYGPSPPYGPPVYGGAPYGTPSYEHPAERYGPCRILYERRVDPYGREIMHRIRVCDEGPVYPGPTDTAAPGYGYPPPPVPYYAPVPSGYDPYPRPPAPVPY